MDFARRMMGNGIGNHNPNVQVSHQSYASKAGGSVCGACFGVVIFFLSLSLVGWNEYRAVATMKSINAARDVYVEGSCNYNSDNNGALTHSSCDLGGFETFNDIGVTNATGLWLTKDVEILQWMESKQTEQRKDSIGGGTTTITTYSYSLSWKSSVTSTSSFSGDCSEYNNYRPCVNPNPIATLGTFTDYASKPTYGDFDLPFSLLKTLTTSKTVNPVSTGDWIANGNYLQYGTGFKSGDQRISYTVSTTTSASILAKQSDNTFVKWDSPHDAAYGMYQITAGTVSGEEMLASAEESNITMTWLLRLVGFGLCWFGLNLITGPISTAPDIIPCVGPLIGDLIEGIACIASGLLAVVFTALVAGIMWLVYRPAIGIPLLIVCFGGIAALVYYGKSKKSKGNNGTTAATTNPPADGTSAGGYGRTYSEPAAVATGYGGYASAPAIAVPVSTYPAAGGIPSAGGYSPTPAYPTGYPTGAANTGYPAAGYPTGAANTGYPAAGYPTAANPGGYPIAGGQGYYPPAGAAPPQVFYPPQ